MKLWYKKWKTQKGEAILVSPLEFVEYYKVNNFPLQWEDGDKFYEGQIYRCKCEDGTIRKLPFRVEINELDKDSYSKNTSLPVNKNPIIEKAPNPITDSWEECTLGIISKDLFPRIDLLGDYIRILTKLEKDSRLLPGVVIRLKLQQAETEEELISAYQEYLNLDKEIKSELKSVIYEELYR